MLLMAITYVIMQKRKKIKKIKNISKKIIMMWNAGDKQKGNVVGCYLHLRLMRKAVLSRKNKQSPCY